MAPGLDPHPQPGRSVMVYAARTGVSGSAVAKATSRHGPRPAPPPHPSASPRPDRWPHPDFSKASGFWTSSEFEIPFLCSLFQLLIKDRWTRVVRWRGSNRRCQNTSRSQKVRLGQRGHGGRAAMLRKIRALWNSRPETQPQAPGQVHAAGPALHCWSHPEPSSRGQPTHEYQA